MYTISNENYQCGYRCLWSSGGHCIGTVANIQHKVDGTVEDHEGVLSLESIISGEVITTTSIPLDEYEYISLKPREDFGFEFTVSIRNVSIFPNIHVTFPSAELNRFKNKSLAILRNAEFVSLPQKSVTFDIEWIANNDLQYEYSVYEKCVWMEYDLQADQNPEFGRLLTHPEVPDITDWNDTAFFEPNPDAVNLIRRAAEICEQRLGVIGGEYGPKHPTVYGTARYSTNRHVDPKQSPDEGNCVIRSPTVYRRITIVETAEGWRVLSELGGTLTLYVSFTLMSLFEAWAFVASREVRRDTDRYELVLEERRNPPILAPRCFRWLMQNCRANNQPNNQRRQSVRFVE